MLLSIHRWALPAVLLLAAALTSAAADPPGPATPEAKKPETAAEKVRKTLDAVGDFVIENQPLELAIQQLAEESKLNFVLDRLTIQNMGIDTNGTEVNVSLKNVKFRTGLRTMLGQHNLSYVVIGEAVVITSEEMAVSRQMRQRVSVDVDKVALADALKQLARDTSTNVMIDSKVAKEAQTPITLELEDVPLETAVQLMAETAGLKPVRVGNVLFVTTKENAKELRQEPDLTPRPQQGGQPQPGQEVINLGLQQLMPAGAVPVAPQPAPLLPPPPLPPPVVEKEKKEAPVPDKPPVEKEKDQEQKQPEKKEDKR